ncbi:uncharacterized protein LOC123307428 [Coccinella septempunctata]|uniref:uncharacterized protein LOC123307428 n=1 Tax=Coccinella septempunctata TaxID=41139 RepID=UPI001D06C99A|nr:uncharacterized protein LOC123307428 [Coccinella septempunctata]
MSNYRENPNAAHNEFEKFINKLASCVSLEDVDKITTILKVKNELVNYNSNLLSTAMSTVIEKLSTSIDLDTKLKNLHELEKESNGPAWRPETGKCDVESIEGEHLKKQVKMLKKKLNEVRNVSSILQVEIEDLRSQVRAQQTEMEKLISCWESQEEKKNIDCE